MDGVYWSVEILITLAQKRTQMGEGNLDNPSAMVKFNLEVRVKGGRTCRDQLAGG